MRPLRWNCWFWAGKKCDDDVEMIMNANERKTNKQKYMCGGRCIEFMIVWFSLSHCKSSSGRSKRRRRKSIRNENQQALYVYHTKWKFWLDFYHSVKRIYRLTMVGVTQVTQAYHWQMKKEKRKKRKKKNHMPNVILNVVGVLPWPIIKGKYQNKL